MKTINLALIVSVLLYSCNKGPELTPVTQEGTNTFSCKVNGKVWIPELHPGSLFGYTTPAISGGYWHLFRPDTIAIFISARTNSKGRIRIFLQDINIGTHLLDNNTVVIDTSGIHQSYATYEYPTAKQRYITTATNTGYVKLTKSGFKTDGIISGTFEFTAINTSGELVRITDGRFDIKSPL